MAAAAKPPFGVGHVVAAWSLLALSAAGLAGSAKVLVGPPAARAPAAPPPKVLAAEPESTADVLPDTELPPAVVPAVAPAVPGDLTRMPGPTPG